MIATAREGAARTMLYGVLATATLLFAAFTAAYIIRREALDWRAAAIPKIVWAGTAVLAASSFTVARRRMGLTLALGLVFLATQALGWRQMSNDGFFLDSNPHAAFFYVLSAVHGVHLVGGLVALGFARPSVAAAYWHFVGVVWLWILGLLSLA